MEWVYAIFGLMVFGGALEVGGDVLSNLVDGRRKIGTLKAQNKALLAENKRWQQFATPGGDTTGMTTLIAHAKSASDCHARAMELLGRVQASDQAYPQLPLEVRADIDTALERYRHIADEPPSLPMKKKP